jgi:signal peptidase I
LHSVAVTTPEASVTASEATRVNAPVKRRVRYGAALVSLVFPGMGQAVLGETRRGLVFAAAALAWGLAYRFSPYGVTVAPSSFWPPAVTLLVLAGLALALGAALDAFRRAAAVPRPRAIRRWLVYAVIAAVPALPSIAAQEAWVHYVVPSASMLPTLMVGDHILAIEGYFASRAPRRGDLAAFRYPRDPAVLFIKRIIGLPGDRVQVKGGTLILNGAPVAVERAADIVDAQPGCRAGRYPSFIETLPGGRRYRTMRGCGPPLFETTGLFAVPADHYFVLGDNRDDSEDSRDPGGGVGFVPAADLVSRAVFVTFSLRAPAQWWNVPRWPEALRWSRTGLLLE